jgi:hypothetical protein
MDTVVTTFIIVVSLEERGSGALYRSPISRACLRLGSPPAG